MTKSLTIKELTEAVGGACTPRMVRHYHQLGLLPQAVRSPSSHLAPRKIDVLSTLSTKPKAPILLRKANKIYVTLLRCF